MTVSMGESQSVVMKKHMPELERLQLRKGRKKKKRERWGRKEKTKFMCKKESPIQAAHTCKRRFLLTSAAPPSFPNCTPAACWHRAGCREYKVEDPPSCEDRHAQSRAPREVQAASNQVCEPTDIAAERGTGGFRE